MQIFLVQYWVPIHVRKPGANDYRSIFGGVTPGGKIVKSLKTSVNICANKLRKCFVDVRQLFVIAFAYNCLHHLVLKTLTVLQPPFQSEPQELSQLNWLSEVHPHFFLISELSLNLMIRIGQEGWDVNREASLFFESFQKCISQKCIFNLIIS